MSLFGGEFEVEDLAEKLLRLFVGEEKFGTVDDREFVVGAQARKRERRHVARDDDDVQHVRQVGEQAIHDAVDGRVRAEVMIVV